MYLFPKEETEVDRKIPADSFKPDANSFAVPVSDPISDQAIGVIYISVEPEFLYKAIDNTRGTIPVAVTVIAPYETDMFYIGAKGTNESWLVGTTPMVISFESLYQRIMFGVGL